MRGLWILPLGVALLAAPPAIGQAASTQQGFTCTASRDAEGASVQVSRIISGDDWLELGLVEAPIRGTAPKIGATVGYITLPAMPLDLRFLLMADISLSRYSSDQLATIRYRLTGSGRELLTGPPSPGPTLEINSSSVFVEWTAIEAKFSGVDQIEVVFEMDGKIVSRGSLSLAALRKGVAALPGVQGDILQMARDPARKCSQATK